jgi:hypothetical protein
VVEIYSQNYGNALDARLPLDPVRCKAGVRSSGNWSRYSQCNRKAGVDGWCKQHHPDAEVKRQAVSNAKYKEQKRKAAIGYYGERMMAALIKIRDGDNNPKEVAEIALEGIEQ